MRDEHRLRVRVGVHVHVYELFKALEVGQRREHERLGVPSGFQPDPAGLELVEVVVGEVLGDVEILAIGVDVPEQIAAGHGPQAVEITVHRRHVHPDAARPDRLAGLIRRRVNGVDEPTLLVKYGNGRARLERAGGGVRLRVIGRQQYVDVVGGIERQLPPRSGRLVIPFVLALARDRGSVQLFRVLVVQDAVVGVVQGRKTPGHALAERTANCGFHTKLAVFGRRELSVSIELLGRLPGDVVDQATRRVATEQGALWTFGDLHPLDVESRERLALRHRDVSVVDVNGDWRLDPVVEVVLCNATNGENGRLTADAAAEIDARGHAGEIDAALEAERPHLVARQRADRDADVLDRLFALLRRDNDFLEHV